MKPRIYKLLACSLLPGDGWVCEGDQCVGAGLTPAKAYQDWLSAWQHNSYTQNFHNCQTVRKWVRAAAIERARNARKTSLPDWMH